MNHPPNPLSLATATVSLGSPGVHDIRSILEAAASNGLKGIEICYNNLHHHAAHLLGSTSAEVDQSTMVRAAEDVKRMCDELGLTIIVLQPFASYDGLVDAEKHRKMVDRFTRWLELAHALGTDTIQMPSNFDKTGTTGDTDRLVADMVEIADLASEEDPVIRIAYEAVAWGAHVDLWEQSWEIVKRLDRPNFGLCLDPFHIAGRVWADPTAQSGMMPDADADLKESLSRLVKDVDVSKVFHFQLSDAERLEIPLVEGHEYYNEAQPARMSWSRNARLFPCEGDRGGYMPVLDVARAVVNELGYRGWISMELFSRHLGSSDADVPAQYARRAAKSYSKVCDELGWKSFLSGGKE